MMNVTIYAVTAPQCDIALFATQEAAERARRAAQTVVNKWSRSSLLEKGAVTVACTSGFKGIFGMIPPDYEVVTIALTLSLSPEAAEKHAKKLRARAERAHKDALRKLAAASAAVERADAMLKQTTHMPTTETNNLATGR
jgi:hypothetical protein